MKTEQIWKYVGDNHKAQFLSGGGHMAEAILAFDWENLNRADQWMASIASFRRADGGVD